MPDQHLIWTVLPNGIQNNMLRASIFMTPRLYDGETLGAFFPSFPEFQNWPAIIKQAGLFSLRVGDVTQQATLLSQPDEGYWTSLFNANTPVIPYVREDYGSRTIKSYPVTQIMQVLRQEYNRVMLQSPTEYPVMSLASTVENDTRVSLKPFVSKIGRLGVATEKIRVREQLNQTRQIQPIGRAIATNTISQIAAAIPDDEITEETVAFAMLDEFYDRKKRVEAGELIDRSNNRLEGLTLADPPPALPDIDFHRVHGILGDYPEIMRTLGFVIDIEVPYTNGMLAEGTVELVAPDGINGIMLTERTHYQLNSQAGLFSAKPRDNAELEIEDGFLSLENPNLYDLTQVDVDGWALKTLGLATDQFNRANVFAASSVNVADQISTGNNAVNSGVNNVTLQQANNQQVNASQVLAAAPQGRDEQGRRPRTIPGNYREEANDTASLPAKRTTGLSVIKKDRALKLAASISANVTRFESVATQVNAIQAELPNQPFRRVNKLTNAPQPPEALYADDLVRGYRVDVFDEEKQQWYSLCKRRGRYRINKDPNLDRLINDEGYVKATALTQEEDDEENAYIHESLFQWDGWSLVAEKPGMTIVPGEVKDQIEDQSTVSDKRYENVGRVKHTTPDAFDLETWFVPEPGSLPRLRFGKDYRLRARTVDLAGNSLPASVPDSSHATEKSCYIRHEPLSSPVVVPRSIITEGEGLERMVIRSNYNQTPAEYVQDMNVQKALSIYQHIYESFNDRHIAPPKTSQQMAELHGAFEAAMGGGKNYQQWFNIAVKESGTFNDPNIVDINTGQKNLQVPNIQLITPPGVPPDQAVGSLEELRTGDPLGPGQYVIHTGEELMLPYLPDFVARGASFVGLPGVPEGSVFQVSFENDFPKARSFRIRIIEGEGVPVFHENHPSGARVLEVKMKKGQISKVRLSCYMSAQDLDHFECAEVINGGNNVQGPQQLAAEPQLANIISEGRHWMVTPWRELVLVHAVQQPLMAPSFQQLTPKKENLGDTQVFLSGQMNLDVWSTGRLDFTARWRDPVDRLGADAPRDGKDGRPEPRENVGRVAEMPIEPYYEDRQSIKFPIKAADFAGGPAYPHHKQKKANFFKHEFGDTKHHKVEYFLTGASRFRDYFPQEIYNVPENVSREGATFEVNIPSSARPAAPKVKYVVPTFGWERKTVDGNPVSRRCGGGLRVYLDRPWYSSGDGELLAVVLRGSAPAKLDQFQNPSPGPIAVPPVFTNEATDDPLRLLTTQWGMDPVWRSLPPPKNPALTNFPDAVKTQNGLRFEETNKGYAAVAGHEVHYDEDRQLWYCDITVDTGDTYFPFMRLALARYQPNSMDGVHLSPVVMTDFIQAVPDRVAALNMVSDDEFRVMLSGPIAWNTISNNLGANESDPDKIKDLMSFSRHVTVTLEKQVGGPDAPWAPVSDELTDVEMPPHQQIGARTIWMKTLANPLQTGGGGQIAVNTGGAPGTTRYRVSIKEFEILHSDPGKNQEFENDADVGFRMVYADSIELSQ
ncbi:MAG: hypothetical protein AAF564_15220 [Bacteroidota bacterium]